MDQAIVARVRETALHTLSKHTPGEHNRHVPLTGTWPRVPKIDVPLLTVNGALDSPDLITESERLADTVPNGRSATVHVTAHYINMEKPEEFNALVTDFLRELC